MLLWLIGKIDSVLGNFSIKHFRYKKDNLFSGKESYIRTEYGFDI